MLPPEQPHLARVLTSRNAKPPLLSVIRKADPTAKATRVKLITPPPKRVGAWLSYRSLSPDESMDPDIK